MNLPPSRILQKLRDHQPAITLKLNLADPRVVELAALGGVDGVWLCMEHVPSDWSAIENQVRAARVRGIDALVRVAKGSYSDYVRPLEAGAAGIIVPHVESAEEARQIVEWCRFHPLGKRAMDGGNIDGNFCLTPAQDYLDHANTERLIILQIESPEGLDQVEAICAVEGFNGILYGPGDFSHRIGKVGQVNDPQVVAGRQRVGAACREHGKFSMCSGLLAPLPELLAEGHSVFNLGADVVALSSYTRGKADAFAAELEGTSADTKAKLSTPYA
jgi:4-hydroxy-2-oxoheptanedioate aldolase